MITHPEKVSEHPARLRVHPTRLGKRPARLRDHPTWRQEPSPQDIRLSKGHPETMGSHLLVISLEKIYHINHDGLVTVVGRTVEVLKLETEEPQS